MKHIYFGDNMKKHWFDSDEYIDKLIKEINPDSITVSSSGTLRRDLRDIINSENGKRQIDALEKLETE